MSQHNDIGKIGEQIAQKYILQQKKYQILDTNWRFSHAEIDIIAKDKETLIFIEVKTRSSNKFGDPEEFISNHQMLLIQDAANEYMKKLNHEWAIRFDIVSIIYKSELDFELKYFEDAWW